LARGDRADLPVVAHVSSATAAEPFLELLLRLDARAVHEVAEKMGLPQPPGHHAYRPISLEPLDAALLDALARLVRLTAEPALVSALAPLIQREITIRLLAGPHGPHLLHVVAAGSPSQQIAKVMSWLKLNFQRTLRMDELATGAHMSPSTFRQHFREIAGMSPLQYQKQLRLQEARQLMLNEKLDASVAGTRVGYESVSQFSREYSRLFGAPPQRDIRRMRMGQTSRQ
jgi:AraC-like DNA-binding protein